MIRTVLGDVPNQSLGHTQCHEHLFIAKGKSFLVNDRLLMDSPQQTEQELLEYANAGGGTIVDAQPVFCGRMALALQRASRHTGVKIISVTGAHKLLFYPDDSPVFMYTEDQLFDLFKQEVQSGMLDETGNPTTICAGLVKVALDAPGNCKEAVYEKVYLAAVNAAKETGTALMVHTEAGSDVLGAVQWIVNQGLPAQRLIVCHLDRTWINLEYHLEVLQSGAFVCYDSINRPLYLSTEQELEFFEQAVRDGHETQVLMGLDTTRARLRAYGANMGLDYICKDFISLLLQSGISRSSIHAFLRDNPSCALRLLEQ